MTISTAPAPPISPGTVEAAKRATYLVFAGSGLAMASFATRIPQIRDHLHLTPSALGLVLLVAAVGSVTSLPLSGMLVKRFGSRAVVAAMAALMLGAMVLTGLGYLLGLPVLVVGLFLFGLSNGAWDVAMNVHGAMVEQLLGRSIMSRFHAGWSLGTVASALVASALVASHVSVVVHLSLIGLVVSVGVVWSVRGFVCDDAAYEPDPLEQNVSTSSALRAWLEPRTLLIGVVVLAFAFTEGAGNDWIGVSTIDGFHVPAVVGTLAFATFLIAMTTGRWFGPTLLDRYGRVVVIRSLAVLAIVGLLLFAFGPGIPFAFLGTVLWGLGASLGFPTGMSAGADNPAKAAGRVSAIASIGYFAFLGGPPLIGFIGNQESVRHALVVVVVLLGLATALSSVLRPPDGPGRRRRQLAPPRY